NEFLKRIISCLMCVGFYVNYFHLYQFTYESLTLMILYLQYFDKMKLRVKSGDCIMNQTNLRKLAMKAREELVRKIREKAKSIHLYNEEIVKEISYIWFRRII